MENSVLLEKIESLRVKESWKKKFRLYAEAGLKSGGFFPKFENQNALKGKFGLIKSPFNIFGFLFGVFYYIYLGMYKKAGLMFLVWTLFDILIGFITENDKSYLLSMWIFGAYFGVMSNYDYYRKQVLGENFWW